MIYETVLRALNEASVRYLVVGGVAVNLHGVPRATADLNLILGLDEGNLLAAVRAFEGLGFRPRAPVPATQLADPQHRRSWIQEKGMRAFSFHDPKFGYREVDILISHSLDFEAAWGRRRTERAGDLEIPVASMEDLIALKRGTGRAQDESDIEALERLRADRGGIPVTVPATRGYRHHHTDEELRRWAAVPAAEKLQWLEEINEFLDRAMSPEAKESARRFRRGEI